jgi:hypothetical protein
MVLATDYPFMDILWTMLIFFAWVVWIWMMVVILTDLFSRTDVSGWGKAAWCIFMIILPFIGVLTYLIAQHDGLQSRSAARAETANRQFDERVRQAAAADGGAAGEIEKAAQLREAGTITQAEFDALKTRALAAH